MLLHNFPNARFYLKIVLLILCFLIQKTDIIKACNIVDNAKLHPKTELKNDLTIIYDKYNNFNKQNDKVTLERKSKSFVEHLFQSGNIKKIIIDAGHGGKDGGCSVGGTNEKDITLKIALLLGNLISENHPDVDVIYTRKKDVFIELDERANIGNRNKADLFISIHCNSISRSNVKGLEVYLLGQHRMNAQYEVAKRENESILMEDNFEKKYGGYNPNSPTSKIILSMIQSNYIEQSTQFATRIEKKIKATESHTSNGVKQAGFLVIRETAMPSVLVETGYLTNETDRSLLKSKDGQLTIATAISEAFTEYKNGLGEGKKEITKDKIKEKERKKQPKIKEEIEISKTKEVKDSIVIEKELPKKKKTSNLTLYYMVQLATSPSALKKNEAKWKSVEQLEERNENGTYKYFEKNVTNFKSANDKVITLREAGFEGAFVVRYIGNERQK